MELYKTEAILDELQVIGDEYQKMGGSYLKMKTAVDRIREFYPDGNTKLDRIIESVDQLAESLMSIAVPITDMVSGVMLECLTNLTNIDEDQ